MMKRFLYSQIILHSLLISLNASENDSLVNKDYIQQTLTFDAPWCESHGAVGEDLGAGMLYYALIYSHQAKLCVCLGSGGGFVPRIMRQAQRDLGLSDSKTVLVDANIGNGRYPRWLSEQSFFRTEFPEVEIIVEMTHVVAQNQGKKWKIDYLHIDADRTFKGAYQDFIDYLPLMSSGGIMTLHDTKGNSPCARVVLKIRELGYQVVNFDSLGAGVAVIYIP